MSYTLKGQYQKPLYLENGGMLITPPNPSILNDQIPVLHETSSKQLYELTTKYRYNGKTFVYGKSVDVQTGGAHINAVLIASKGCMNSRAIAISYSTTIVQTHAAGAEYVDVTLASTTEDQYKYGHLILGHQSTTLVQNRGIVGNSETGEFTSGQVRFYLDIPLSHATTLNTTSIEGWECPYKELEWAGEDYQYASVMGIPMVNKAAPLDNDYFWLQTWGPCWVCPGAGALGASVRERQAVFDSQGQLAAPATTYDDLQIAGYLIEKTKSAEDSVSAYDGEFIMLQLDP